MKNCLIVSGGEYSGKPAGTYDFVIACDKGLEYALKDGLDVNLTLGDFDSFEGEIPAGIETIKLPCKKDDTDTMYAVKYALNHGFSDITISSALGKRMDHAFGNLQALAFIKEQGGKAKALGLYDEIVALKNEELIFPFRENTSLSVYSFSDVSEGVTIKGAEYETENWKFTSSNPVGTSNEWKEDKISVRVKEGILFVVMSQKR